MKSTKLHRWIFWGSFTAIIGLIAVFFLGFLYHFPHILFGMILVGIVLLGVLGFTLLPSVMSEREIPIETYFKLHWEQVYSKIGVTSYKKRGEQKRTDCLEDPAIQKVNANRWEIIIQIEGVFQGMDYILEDIKTKYQEKTGRETVLFQGFCIRIQTTIFPENPIHMRTKDYFNDNSILPGQTLLTPLQRYYPAFVDNKNGILICVAGNKELVAGLCNVLLQRLQNYNLTPLFPFALWLNTNGVMQLTISNQRIFDYSMDIVNEEKVQTSLQLIQNCLVLLHTLAN